MFIILAEKDTGKLHLITDNVVIAEQMTTVGVKRETDLPVWYVGSPTLQTAKEVAAAIKVKFEVEAYAQAARQPGVKGPGPAFTVCVRSKGLREVPMSLAAVRTAAQGDEEPPRDEKEADPLIGQRMDSADVEGS